jgi:hypothetical protein
MRRTIELDGSEWTVEGFLGVDAARRAAAEPSESPRPAAVPASVPGSILDDLWRAGRVPNPYVGLNSRYGDDRSGERCALAGRERREVDAAPTGRAALGVRLEDDRPIEAHGWAEVEDAGFHLLPREARTVAVHWAEDDDADVPRELRLSAWNIAETTVPAS